MTAPWAPARALRRGGVWFSREGAKAPSKSGAKNAAKGCLNAFDYAQAASDLTYLFAPSRDRVSQRLETGPMDASETGKAPKADNRQAEARDARLAKALRANLRRRKAPDIKPQSAPDPGARDGQD